MILLAALMFATSCTDQPRADCFAPGATWADSSGQVPAAEGLRSLEGQELHRVRASSATLWVGAETKTEPRRHLILVLDDGAQGWTAARLYSAASRWPRPPDERISKDPRDLAALLDAFNTRFSVGDAPGWLSHWAPEAVWDSASRRFVGSAVSDFFSHQAARYAQPHLQARDLTSARTPGFLVEGTLSGACRSNGKSFSLPVLLLLRVKQHKIHYGWEAILKGNDGCGPFWDSQPQPE